MANWESSGAERHSPGTAEASPLRRLFWALEIERDSAFVAGLADPCHYSGFIKGRSSRSIRVYAAQRRL